MFVVSCLPLTKEGGLSTKMLHPCQSELHGYCARGLAVGSE